MIHTPLTRLIEFAAAIPAMVAPNVLPRGQPMPCAEDADGRAPNRTDEAGVWAATKPSLAGGLCTPAPSRGSVMDTDIAAEVGKIAALVARLGNSWEFNLYKSGIEVVRWDFQTVIFEPFASINITKTRKTRRIPMLRVLADKLRAELKERKK